MNAVTATFQTFLVHQSLPPRSFFPQMPTLFVLLQTDEPTALLKAIATELRDSTRRYGVEEAYGIVHATADGPRAIEDDDCPLFQSPGECAAVIEAGIDIIKKISDGSKPDGAKLGACVTELLLDEGCLQGEPVHLVVLTNAEQREELSRVKDAMSTFYSAFSDAMLLCIFCGANDEVPGDFEQAATRCVSAKDFPTEALARAVVTKPHQFSMKLGSVAPWKAKLHPPSKTTWRMCQRCDGDRNDNSGQINVEVVGFVLSKMMKLVCSRSTHRIISSSSDRALAGALHRGMRDTKTITLVRLVRPENGQDNELPWYGLIWYSSNDEISDHFSMHLSWLSPGEKPFGHLPPVSEWRSVTRVLPGFGAKSGVNQGDISSPVSLPRGNTVVEQQMLTAKTRKLTCSYNEAGRHITWSDDENGVLNDFSKALRTLKRLPDKAPMFYKDLKKLVTATKAFGYTDILPAFLGIVKRDCKSQLHIDHLTLLLNDDLVDIHLDNIVPPESKTKVIPSQ